MHYTTPSVLGGVEQVMGAHAAALLSAGVEVTIVAGRGRAVPPGVKVARIPETGSTHPRVLRDLRALARGEVTADHARLVAGLVRALGPHVRRADRVVVHNVLTMHKNLALAEALAALAQEHRGRNERATSGSAARSESAISRGEAEGRARKVVAWTHDIAWLDPRYAAERHAGDPWDVIGSAVPGVRYVAVSEERARQLAELTGMPRSTVTVVPNGIDLPARLGLSPAGARLVERLGLLDARPLLLLPARLTRRKRIEVAIDATRELRRVGREAALVVTGSPGPHNLANRGYAAELASRARRSPGVHLLHTLGIRVSERVLADLYRVADAVVLPSEAEGFGIPIIEAGAHGVPVVCSDLATLRAVAGDAATYVRPDADGVAFAAAIERRLATDPVADLRRRAKDHAWPRLLKARVLPAILDGAAAG